MRAVIADDEELVRYGIRDMLKEVSVAVRVVAEAENGRELIEQCKKEKPDLAFVDIRMPAVGGLEAIEELREISPDTEWLILTSYSEFDYAHKALKIGAAEYLLKPVGPEELDAALKRVADRRLNRLVAANQAFENRVAALLDNARFDEDAEGWRYEAVLAVVDSGSSRDSTDDLHGRMTGNLRNEIADLLTSNTRVAVMRLANVGFVSVLGWHPGRLEMGTSESLRERFVNRICRSAQTVSDASHEATILFSDPFSPLSKVRSAVEHLRRLSSFRPVAGFGQSHKSAELEELASFPAAVELAERLSAARNAWGEHRSLAFDRAVREASRLFRDNSDLRADPIRRNIERYLDKLVSPLCGPLGESADWLPDLLESMLNRRSADGREPGSAETVEQVMHYIEENYARDASITHIADLLGLSPNYLSTLFHKRAGTTFMKHLTRIRMDKARELLVRSNLTVSEVAAEVGYASTRHFARTFKNLFNTYPSELRRETRREPRAGS